MSVDSDSKPYLYPGLEGQDGASGCRGASSCSSVPRGASGCSSMAQLHRMGGFGQGGPDPGPPASPHGHRSHVSSHSLQEEDVEMKSSGSSGSGTESHGNESHGTESHGNESHGHESTDSSNSNSKDSALLESSGSNKSSNSDSPSPPSSSNAFSLLSSEQDNPSTSGCSSEESAKAKTQKELSKALKELKRHLPTEKRSKGSKSTTLGTLKYALRCVKQVEANEEYYQLLMTNDSQPSGLNVSSYTIEEIDSITSEYTLKNNDIFAVAVSLITGKIVYISDQAASILNCKRDVFKNAKFVEFLSPQDVSVFYGFTTPYHLPSWSMCTGAESSPPDCMEEKSFFCRISGRKECQGDQQYYPFRMAPYLMKVQDREHAEDQLCCLLLAERVHSGYEAPRIPMDKRIFTTTHTTSCVFQDVDERAVPLLGYLPQDLIGTPVLLHLHPNDRPIMLAIHRKILQFAGQPFDHSSIRFCARNGEYIMIDTSWSSFVNPWSRKVSFVIGRHKVRMGPVNEDVFVAPAPVPGETKTMDPDVQEITEQIHRLLLQPVHINGSSGYGSNEHMLGMTSSSESLPIGHGNKSRPEEEGMSSKAKPRTFQEICKGIHLQKNQEQQQGYLASPAKQDRKSNGKCLQKSSAVVRPKDSATPLSWKETGATMEESRASFQEELAFNDQTVYSYQQISCLDSVIRYLESCNLSLTMKRKCHSFSNTASSNEDEGTQKGDCPMQVSEEITEDVSGAGESPASAVSPPSQEREPYRKRGLTKQVLAAHTQKEEQAFLCRFRQLRGVKAFKANCAEYLERQRGQLISDAVPMARSCKQGGTGAEPAARRSGRNKKTKSKRVKQNESSDSTVSHQRQQPTRRPPLLNQGLNQTSWSLSDTSQSTFPMAYPAGMPGYPLEVYAGAGGNVAPCPAPSLTGFVDGQCSQAPPSCPPQIHSAPYAGPMVAPVITPMVTPMVTPVMTLVLPNYMFPQMDNGPVPQQPFYPTETGAFPAQAFAQTAFPGGQGSSSSFPFPAQSIFTIQAQLNPQSPFVPPSGYLTYPFPFSLAPDAPKAPAEGQSRSSTPQSGVGRDQASPPLFQSRCSSPLQLNLLQLEERLDSTVPSAGGQGNNTAEREKGASVSLTKEKELKQTGFPCGGNDSDANSLSSDTLDLLLRDDSHSGTDSGTSGSMGSGSRGCGTSASGTSNSRTSASRTSGSGTSGSNNSSHYFGSVDSSQNSQNSKGHLSSSSSSSQSRERRMEVEESKQFLSDVQRVLREDQEKLRRMQKNQPRFTDNQKRELLEFHPWMRTGGLSKAIDVTACSCCGDLSEAVEAAGRPDLDMGDTETETGEVSHERSKADTPSSTDTPSNVDTPSDADMHLPISCSGLGS